MLSSVRGILELSADVLKADGTVVITGKAIVKVSEMQEEE